MTIQIRKHNCLPPHGSPVRIFGDALAAREHVRDHFRNENEQWWLAMPGARASGDDRHDYESYANAIVAAMRDAGMEKLWVYVRRVEREWTPNTPDPIPPAQASEWSVSWAVVGLDGVFVAGGRQTVRTAYRPERASDAGDGLFSSEDDWDRYCRFRSGMRRLMLRSVNRSSLDKKHSRFVFEVPANIPNAVCTAWTWGLFDWSKARGRRATEGTQND